VREFGAEVVTGATELVTDAVTVVSEIVESITETKPSKSRSTKKAGDGTTAAPKSGAKKSSATRSKKAAE
jgi:hypothetical protein